MPLMVSFQVAFQIEHKSVKEIAVKCEIRKAGIEDGG